MLIVPIRHPKSYPKKDELDSFGPRNDLMPKGTDDQAQMLDWYNVELSRTPTIGLYLAKGLLLMNYDRYLEAVEVFSQVLRLETDNGRAKYELDRAIQLMAKIDRPVKDYDTSFLYFPMDEEEE